LLKLQGPWYATAVTAGLFLSGAACCFLGLGAIQHGHRYYRRTIVKKTLLEHLIGLPAVNTPDRGRVDLTISTTSGQAARERITSAPQEYINGPIRWGSATGSVILILWLVLLMNLAGTIFATVLAYHAAQPSAILPVPPEQHRAPVQTTPNTTDTPHKTTIPPQ
jgi:hypothetical protein